MIEEELKAIEYFKALNELTFEPYLSILLNLIDKQQKEIEYLKGYTKVSGRVGGKTSE